MKRTFKFSQKKALISALISISALSYSLPGFALGPQAFLNIAYSNPAMLNMVKKLEGIIGGSDVNPDLQFSGTYGGVSSSARSNTNSLVPYGRIAYRFSPTIVGGIDVTQPLFTADSYPSNSFISTATINTYLRDTDISPRISWQATEKLALGLGVNFNNLYNAVLSSAIPRLGILDNKADDWAYGFNAGAFYNVRLGTLVGLSYYSKIVHHVVGTSIIGPLRSNNLRATVNMPATTSLDIIQFLSPKWVFDATIRYIGWSSVRYLVLQNTPLGTVTVPEFYFNSWDYALATKYDINDKWSVIAKVNYSPTSQPTAYVTPGLPTGSAIIGAVGAQYNIGKGISAKFLYAHVYMNPNSNVAEPLGQLIGHTEVNANVYDLSFTYDI